MMNKGRFLAALLALCLSFTLAAQPAALAAETHTENAVSESVEVSSLTPNDAGFWDELRPEYADDGEYMKLFQYYQTHGVKTLATKTYPKSQFYTGITNYTHGPNQGKKYAIGVDVSHNNGTIDWAKVKEAGVDFAIIRCAYSGYGSADPKAFSNNTDRTFVENITAALEQGIPVGIYYFSQAKTVAEAQKEAEYTVNVLKNYKSKITLPVYLDVEQGTYPSTDDKGKPITREYRINSVTAAQGVKNAKAYFDILTKAGFKVGLYGNAYDIKTICDYTKLTDYPLWLAHYKNAPEFTGQFEMWQYSSSGYMPGFSGAVDCNFLYYESTDTPVKPPVVTITPPEVEPPTEPETPVVPEVPEVPAEKPEKVTGVAKAGCTTSSITVKWNAAKGADKYRIYVCTTKSGTYEIADTIDASATSYTVKGLKNNYAYYFKVRAWNSNGWGSTSSAMSAITSKGDARTLYTTNKVNLRSGAGTDYTKLASVPKNTLLNVSSERMGSDGLSWYKVTYTASGKSYTGYLCGSYVKVGLRAKTKAKIKLLSSAKTSASSKVTIASGKKVILLSSTKGSDGKTWYKTFYKTGSKTYTGYLPSSKVTKY